jgi:UDP-N-acetylmuramate dehydrogenase
MLLVQENVSLKPLNTFAIDAKARYLATVSQPADVKEITTSQSLGPLQPFILGGGSNTLLRQNLVALVIKVEIGGIDVISETSDDIVVEVGAGENWHHFVATAVNSGWGGIENLAYIPGTMGGAPVQNLAAYGHNFVDVFDSLEAIHLGDGSTTTFSKEACQFGYRQSIFKTKLSQQYLITKVRVKLRKIPQLETSYYSIGGSYDSIAKELEANFQPPYTIASVFQAVINIRKRKLPEVSEVPSVGSFFINPVVSRQSLDNLLVQIPELQYYPIDQLQYKSLEDPELAQADYVKVPVGRILDELGWRGRQIGNCRVYEHWASIITHNGKATGEELYQFTQLIKADVKSKYGIDLQSEVTFV